jgi:hypothetical protein
MFKDPVLQSAGSSFYLKKERPVAASAKRSG